MIVGLAINLLSAYIKTPIDRAGSKIFSKWKARSTRARERLAYTAKLAADDPRVHSKYRHRSLVFRSRSNAWLLCLAISLLIYALDNILIALSAINGTPILGTRTPMQHGNVIFGIAAVISIVGAMKESFSATDVETVITLADIELAHRAAHPQQQ